MAGTDFSHLTTDELIKGIKALDLPDYIRSKAYGIDVRETLAQMTEMTIQLGVNMGLSPDDALKWARKLQESVSQSEFDSWVATLLDGGPSIFMNTLSELQAKYPNGAAGVALVRETDPAKIYVWNGTAWEDFGVYQGIEIKDGAVTSAKIAKGAVTADTTNFLKTTGNLFNKDDVTSNMLLNGNGELVSNDSFSTSKAIWLKAGTYSINNVRVISQYSASNAHITSNVLSVSGPNTFTLDSDSNVKVSVPNSTLSNTVLTQGSQPVPTYIPQTIEFLDNVKISVENIQGKIDIEDTDIASPINYYDKNKATRDYMVGTTSGGLSQSSATIGVYAVTDMIKVTPGIYYLTKNRNVVLYDENQIFLKSFTSTQTQVEVEQDGYLRATLYIDDIDTTMITKDSQPAGYESFGTYILNESIKVSPQNIVGAQSSSDIMIHFGDSNTANGNLINKIQSVTGMKHFNFAVGGTRLVDVLNPSSGYQRLNFLDILRAKASGDWTNVDEAVTSIDYDVITNRMETLKTLDMSTVKYLSFMYGTNDIAGASLVLGASDSTSTYSFNGALNEAFDIIFNNWPHIRVYAFGPIFRPTMPYSDPVQNSDEWSINGEFKLYDLAEAIGSKAKEFKTPFKNLYYESGINVLNWESFISDGTHLNAFGEDMVGEKMARFIMNN